MMQRKDIRKRVSYILYINMSRSLYLLFINLHNNMCISSKSLRFFIFATFAADKAVVELLIKIITKLENIRL